LRVLADYEGRGEQAVGKVKQKAEKVIDKIKDAVG